jgi:superfamily II DNA/RNA helicase
VFENIVILPEVIVTTPERCLLLHSIQPEAFANLGLIVFDECHLLHPKDSDRSRRSVDSMLALLNLTAAAPQADLLMLSAMMKNAEEIAAWVREITGRPCLPLDLCWKPTRQVRGSVVYPAQRIDELNRRLAQARQEFPDKKNGAPAAVERELTAPAYGLFCLLQTWASTEQSDYTLLPLLDDPPHFTTALRKNGRWALTPNGNKLSAAIAAAGAASRIKTLVFVQSTVLAHSAAAKEFPKLFKSEPVALTEGERKLYDLAVEEMGGAEYCYLQLGGDGLFHGGTTSHHALLLREERHLHESLFKRADGIDVLFATSTLAQGMNLPSEIVIIAGDSRFDSNAGKMEVLEAHELLNAAGRAGRAGERSQGFVLVVPSRVIHFNEATGTIDNHWATLQNIFEQADQCLVIDDPFAALLDQIHAGAVEQGMPSYLLSKLPVSAGEDPSLAARALLSRSLAAFRASKQGKQDWIDSRIAAALAAKKARDDEEHRREWLDLVSGSTGVPVEMLLEIEALLNASTFNGNAREATAVLLAWLEQSPERLLHLVRPENLEGLFGEDYKQLKTDRDRGARALPVIRALLPLWMDGKPLCDVEKSFLKKESVGLCKYARHFALRVVPDLAFIAGLPARILIARWKAEHEPEAEPAIPTVLSTLQAIVREGCDSPESLATKINLGQRVSRVAARAHHEAIKGYAAAGDAFESFEETRGRMRTADLVFRLSSDD